MNLQHLQSLFPKTAGNCATTGRIPMSFVAANEKAIAEVVKSEGLRRIYRGPRGVYRDQTFTHKANAKSVLLYRV